MLDFKEVTLEDKKLLNSYFYAFGENSCQHSFCSMFCTKNKYNDNICEDENYLFTLRKNLENDKERFYLFPMGDVNDKKKLSDAINKIFDDAREYGKKVCFNTITKKNKEILRDMYGDKFTYIDNRDYYEYIYTFDRLANLTGSSMASKRYDLKTFFRDYGDRIKIRKIKLSDIEEIKKFQARWLNENNKENEKSLILENMVIDIGLKNYLELELSGIVVFIDNEIIGYAYGNKISETAYDVLIEKGDRKYADIYKVLNRDLVRFCCNGFKYINREEDLGISGLRKSKLSYKPDYMIEKYIAKEV